MSVNNDFDVIYVDQSNDSCETIIRSTFKKVDVVTNQKDVMKCIMSREDSNVSILLLINIDQFFPILEKICQSIQYHHLINIIPVACSKNDSSSLMVRCIETGASDFILKPFQESVIKTMFLNVYRHKSQNINRSVPKDQPKITNLSQFQGRFENDNWLSNTILKHYTPEPSTERLSTSNLSDERLSFLNQFVCDWNFSPLELDERDLVQCVFIMLDQTFVQLPELNSLRMEKDIMYDFIFDVYNSYHNSNPYHNFKHAVDVMQSTWYCLCSIGALKPIWWSRNQDIPDSLHEDHLKKLLRPVDILALLMASLGHDVGHPGVNNGFMITTATPLAVLYNDVSVLESYHAMAFFNILRKYYAISNVDVNSFPDYKDFRRIVVYSILCTDMGCHQDYLGRIQSTTKKMANHGHLMFEEDTERLVLCSAIMKCADISNCTRSFDNAKQWAILLADEFSIQGDLEKELGIPSIAINERGKVSLPDFQLFFMKNVALDLYSTFGELFPQMKFCANNIGSNIAVWEDLKAKS
ncbi:hypothetical protein BDF21DRAFT_406378 [Thamnidium elegans]|nr:hypothetical protein BDF21DRAFT_406378 [Thamnidium elegans]